MLTAGKNPRVCTDCTCSWTDTYAQCARVAHLSELIHQVNSRSWTLWDRQVIFHKVPHISVCFCYYFGIRQWGDTSGWPRQLISTRNEQINTGRQYTRGNKHVIRCEKLWQKIKVVVSYGNIHRNIFGWKRNRKLYIEPQEKGRKIERKDIFKTYIGKIRNTSLR